MSIFHVGLPEVRFRVWGWEVIPAGAGRVGRQCFHPKLHRNCAGRDLVIMACSVCCSFCFTSLLHQEISLFPLHATKKLNLGCISDRNLGFFSLSQAVPALEELGGESSSSCESWGAEGAQGQPRGRAHPHSFTMPRQ